MQRQHDRPATVAATINAVFVFVLPVAVVTTAMAITPNTTVGTTVVGVDPDRAAALMRKAQMIAGYLAFMAPFAMAAAWRTFVHAKRWLAGAGHGAHGILEAAACGFAGALVVLTPGIVTHPMRALPYVIAYGGLSAIIGLAFGAVLWLPAAAVLSLIETAGNRKLTTEN